jgi:hypothetical protein
MAEKVGPPGADVPSPMRTSNFAAESCAKEEGGGSVESVRTGEADEVVEKGGRFGNNGALKKAVWDFVTWTPRRCRYDAEKPPKFSMSLNFLFAFVSLISVWSAGDSASASASSSADGINDNGLGCLFLPADKPFSPDGVF